MVLVRPEDNAETYVPQIPQTHACRDCTRGSVSQLTAPLLPWGRDLCALKAPTQSLPFFLGLLAARSGPPRSRSGLPFLTFVISRQIADSHPAPF